MLIAEISLDLDTVYRLLSILACILAIVSWAIMGVNQARQLIADIANRNKPPEEKALTFREFIRIVREVKRRSARHNKLVERRLDRIESVAREVHDVVKTQPKNTGGACAT